MSLDAWLTIVRRARTRAFEVDDLSEARPRNMPQIQYLAELVENAKADPAVKQDLVDLLNWTPRTGRPPVRKGEFGEIVAAAVLEEFDGWPVPVKKLRYQIDPEQTLPGNDVVAFVISDDEIERITFVECKLRTTAALAAATDAHAQLEVDRAKGFADILAFILQRLHEQHHPLLDPLRRHLRREDVGDRREYQVALMWDSATWDERVIDRLDPLPQLLDPLTVRVTQCVDLGPLVDEVFAEAAVDLVDDEL